MVILGSTFLGADYSFSPCPTDVSKIHSVKIENGTFDTIITTNDISYTVSLTPNTTWDNNTIMCATFDLNIDAGNMEYVLDNTSTILIKRREKGTFEWTTILKKDINTLDDFKISFNDFMSIDGKTYEYAYVGALNGVEGNYNISEITCDFYGLFIAEKDKIYGTVYDITCNNARKHYVTRTEFPSHKYPGRIKTSNTNYDSIDISAFFVKNNIETGEIYPSDSEDYRIEVIDFLSNGNPKFIKYGKQAWLGVVDGDVSTSEDGHYDHKITSFSFYESGDYTSEKDLYETNLSDVTAEYWSNE